MYTLTILNLEDSCVNIMYHHISCGSDFPLNVCCYTSSTNAKSRLLDGFRVSIYRLVWFSRARRHYSLNHKLCFRWTTSYP